MRLHAANHVANGPAGLEESLIRQLLRDAPDLFFRVLAECRRARAEGHPELVTEMLLFALDTARTIKQLDEDCQPH